MGYWKVITPITSTNYVLNPVAMGTGNYANVATGTVSAVTTYSYLGYKCYRIVGAADNDGGSFTLSTLSNAIHYMTLRINSASDITPMIDVSLDNANFSTPTLLSTEGDWYVYGVQFPAAQANGSTTLYILQNGAGAISVFVGHIQVEPLTYATTPITGDVKGFCEDGYYWLGSPHTSPSVRHSKERSGGLEVDVQTSYNFMVKSGYGSGMPPIQHHTQGMALLPGSLYQGYKVQPRVLDLVSSTKTTNVASILAARKNFLNAIKPDLVSPDQPVVFRYSGVNSVKPVDFYTFYDSGMEFQTTSGVIDQPVARFICYDPFVYRTHTQSAALTTSATVANADYIVRKINGTWYNVHTDFGAQVYTLTQGADGIIYIGGAFTNVGAATGDYIVKWNPYTSAISSLTGGSGSGTDGNVYALTTAANGDIYLGGAFTLAGAIANTAYIAYWDVSASEFVALSTGLTAAARALVFDNSGKLYIGGNFTNVGDANGDYITYWSGAAFVSMGTGMNDAVYTLAYAANGDIYAGGVFTLAGGVANTVAVAKWNGTAWLPLGTGLAGGAATCYAMVSAPNGDVYVGGSFTTADGVSCANIAKWNGKTFEPLGSGLNGIASSLAMDSNGLLYVSGGFTTAGGISTSDRMAIWNGTTWAHVDINLPGAPTANVFLPVSNIIGTRAASRGGTPTQKSADSPSLYVGYSTSGSATSSYLNTVTNSGSATAYPLIKIHRAEDGTAAVVEWIKNETTGDTLWCNYSLLMGETLTIDLTPGEKSIYSNYWGDVWRAVLRSSDFSTLGLLPGTNNISVFVNSTGATITAWAEWKITEWGADQVAA